MQSNRKELAMPPITIHNLPVAPREVQFAFTAFNEWMRNRNPDSHWVQPTELDYCAILHDTGIDSVTDRLMLIEACDEGYPFELLVIFRPDGGMKGCILNADDEDSIEVLA